MAFTVTGSTATHTTATSHTITLPTFAENDTVIISAAWNGASGATTCDNGFVKNSVIDDTVTNFSDGTANPRISVYEKRMTAADVAAQPLTVTLTTTNAITSGIGCFVIHDSAGEHYCAFHSRWTFSNSSTGTATTDTLDNLPTNSIVVGAVASHGSTINHTITTTDAVEVYDTVSGKANGGAVLATSATSKSLTWTQSTTASWMAWIMAFAPVPTPLGEQNLLISDADIAALPTTGAEWTAVVADADTNDPVNDEILLRNQTDWGEPTSYLAAALVYKRTGTTSYRDDVIAALRKVIGSDQIAPTDATPDDSVLLAIIRNLYGYILAADLIDFDQTLTGTRSGWTTVSWQEWLLGAYPESGGHIVDRIIGTQGRWHSIRKTAYNSASNWGSQARATYAVIAAHTGDTARFAEATRIFKASLGDLAVDHFGYPIGSVPPHFEEDGFYPTAALDSSYINGYNGAANPPTQGTPSWRAINALGVTNPDDGVAVEDLSRSTAAWPDYDQVGLEYQSEYILGLLAHAIVIERYDSPLWTHVDSAINRALDFLNTAVGVDAFNGWDAVTTNNSTKWVADIANLKYSESYTTAAQNNTGAAGRMLGHGDWLFQEVASPPGAVDDLACTPSGADVNLTWTPPPDGGSPITDYLVYVGEEATFT